MKKKPSKIERFIRNLPGDKCAIGLTRAVRMYRGLTLAQAWRQADSRDLAEVCEAFGITVPERLKCSVCPGENCWAYARRSEPSEFRKLLRGIPAAVQRAYAKA